MSIKSQNLPNLFIVGAARSGTTSLHNYLNQHPDIYMSPNKEPRFFSSSYQTFPQRGKLVEDSLVVDDWEDYTRLFYGVDNQAIVGESSTDYLFYPQVAQDIKDRFPNARILIILRDPVERAFSSYMLLVRKKLEDKDFAASLELEEERYQKNYSSIWFYKRLGRYYGQVKRYLDVFGSKSVKVLLFEDFKNDTREILGEVFDFLGVDPTYQVENLTKYNVSGSPKSYLLEKFILYPPMIIKDIYGRVVPAELRERIWYAGINSLYQKPVIDARVSSDLKAYFREDILKLQGLIGQDLSSWLS